MHHDCVEKRGLMTINVSETFVVHAVGRHGASAPSQGPVQSPARWHGLGLVLLDSGTFLTRETHKLLRRVPGLHKVACAVLLVYYLLWAVPP